MSAYRKQTRVFYQASSGVALASSTDISNECRTPSADTASIPLETTGYIYLGFHQPFASRYFYLSTANTNAASLTVEFYNGSSWSEFEDVVDLTEGFTQSGFLHFTKPEGTTWQSHELISNVKLYWARVSTSANFSAGTVLQGVFNLFISQEDVALLYPALINDSRWLPKGQTTWYPTLMKATDLVVRRMVQKKLITDESEIIDINQVSEAATHAFAVIVYRPVAHTSEERMQAFTNAKDDFDAELSMVRIDVDLDNSGLIESNEEQRRVIAFTPRY